MNIKTIPEHDILLQEKAALEKKIRELEEIERNDFITRARAYVGKCYRYVGTDCYFKIINVPQVEWTMTGSNFNEYQFPAFFIDEEEDVPFYNDTVYLNLKYGIPEKTPLAYTRKAVQEISAEEFNENLDAIYEEWIAAIRKV